MAADPDAEAERRVREGLRLRDEDLEALRRVCLTPGRNAMAQVAALRLRLEYSQSRPPSEQRLKLDPAGPLTVRFDLSGVQRAPEVAPRQEAPALPSPTAAPPPGVDPGAGGGLAQGPIHTENFPPSHVPAKSAQVLAPLAKWPTVRRNGLVTLPRKVEGEAGDLPQKAEEGVEP